MQALIRRTLSCITSVNIKPLIAFNSGCFASRPFGVLSFISPEVPRQNRFLCPATPIVQPCCGLKIRGKPKLRCKDCYFVVRQERLYVMCRTFGRHKQMAMQKKPINTWILTHATQGKVRPW